ncbi:MAG TPA: RES family NAD+ phosphorylase [Planctomycetota bacterium]|nr:RES family NAD+ phosphorylase [Planctomycetota bacterium]
MTTLSISLFGPVLRRMPGRAETGRWLRAMPAHRIRDLLDPHLSTRRGGRVNPPGSFPVLYAVADEAGCRPPLAGLALEESETVVAVFSVTLTRVLDLAVPGVRRELGVSLRDLLDGDESRIFQAIGVAAYNEGFEGVIYPRPLNPKCRNLAIFSDRISSENIQLLELKTPGRARA